RRAADEHKDRAQQSSQSALHSSLPSVIRDEAGGTLENPGSSSKRITRGEPFRQRACRGDYRSLVAELDRANKARSVVVVVGMPVPVLMLPLAVAAMLPTIVFPSIAGRSRGPAACHPDIPHSTPVPVARNPKRIREGSRRAPFFDQRRRRGLNDLRAARRRRRLVHHARLRRISWPPVALVEKPNAPSVLPRRWLPDISRSRRQDPMSLDPELPVRTPCPIACDPLMTERWRRGRHFHPQSRR